MAAAAPGMWVKDKHGFYNTETGERRGERPMEGFRLYHILVKHNRSRRPVDVTEEEALRKISGIYEELGARINDPDFREFFKEMASRHSDCSSSKRGGDLGFVCGNEMTREFEGPAFSLKRGQIVGPVKTPSGFHIIYRR
jgi:peptidyl-prolyl cis-trans isomerase NIMA-interacting 1